MYALHNFPMQDVFLREADVNTDYNTMCTIEAMWAQDYRAAGDTCNTGKAIVDKLFSGRHTKVYIVEVLGKTAGFMVLQKQAAAITIDIVYVLPKYRKRGLATQLYQTAISNFGAEQISLSYRRVIAKLPVTSRRVVWLFLEQLWLEIVPVLHRLQGRLTAQG